MKRLVSGLLALALAATGFASAAPAYADGLGAPLINGPVEGQVFEQGDVVHFDVSFADTPYGTYQLNIYAPDGTSYFTATKFHEAGPNPVAIFERTPETVGTYNFSITYDTGGGAEVADVHFSVVAPQPQPPRAPTPQAPVIKRPSAPRSAHTTVASKRVRLLWAVPAITGGAAITGYQVKKGQTVRNLGAGARSTLFTGLKNKRLYSFAIRAKNRAGWSAWSHASGKPHKPKKVKKKKHHKPKHSTPHAPAAHEFANCTAMHQVYPHGVGRPGAVDNGGVTDFYVSAALYNANTKSDRDKDGVACEA